MVEPYCSELKQRRDPSPRKRNNVFISLAVICYQAYLWDTICELRGGWSGDMLIAGWDDWEKSIASQVHVERFKS